jgi:hypothetical protein
MRRIASASADATDSILSLATHFSAGIGTVLVETISSTSCRWLRRSLAKPFEQLNHGAASGDLVIEHDDVAAGDITDDCADLDVIITEALLGSGRHRGTQQPGECGGRLGISKIGRHHNGVGQIALLEVPGKLAQRVQMIDRTLKTRAPGANVGSSSECDSHWR